MLPFLLPLYAMKRIDNILYKHPTLEQLQFRLFGKFSCSSLPGVWLSNCLYYALALYTSCFGGGKVIWVSMQIILKINSIGVRQCSWRAFSGAFFVWAGFKILKLDDIMFGRR